MNKRNLVIVRAGNASLHPHWLEGEGERNWDLVVSYFGDDPDLYRIPDVVRIDAKGPKWPPLFDLINAHPSYLTDYDYIWLPDDDLLATKQDINRMFDICRAYKLGVAQPSLTGDSYYSHLWTLHLGGANLRYMNFVEVMAPCLSAETLREAFPLFKETMSGFGLDFVIPKIAAGHGARAGIIDAVTVKHTRPIGGPNYKHLEKAGVTPAQEFRRQCERHGVVLPPPIIIFGAVLQKGKSINLEKMGLSFACMVVKGYGPAVFQAKNRKLMLRHIVAIAAKSLFGIPYKVMGDGAGTRARKFAGSLIGRENKEWGR